MVSSSIRTETIKQQHATQICLLNDFLTSSWQQIQDQRLPTLKTCCIIRRHDNNVNNVIDYQILKTSQIKPLQVRHVINNAPRCSYNIQYNGPYADHSVKIS